MPRRKVKQAAPDPNWARVEQLSRRQAQSSMMLGVVGAIFGMALAFWGILWAGLRAPNMSNFSTWPTPAKILVSVGATAVMGGVAWALIAQSMRSRWERDIRRLRDR